MARYLRYPTGVAARLSEAAKHAHFIRACVGSVAVRTIALSSLALSIGAAASTGTPSRSSVRSATVSSSREAVSTRHYYVAAGGAQSGPCSKSQPCRSLDHAVSLANHIPFAEQPVSISVGKGTFITHLNFPDQPYPEKSLAITGESPGTTKLSAAGSGMVLIALADAPPIDVQNLTITGGTGTNHVGGGAVHDGGNFMNFFHVTFANNVDTASPSSGGAIFDDAGTMTITDSTISHNSAGSTSSPGLGGGVSEVGGSLTITASIISGNSVQTKGVGGGLYVNDGHLKVEDSTITGNSALATATGTANMVMNRIATPAT